VYFVVYLIVVFVMWFPVVARVCNDVSTGSNECQSGSYSGVSADMCFCDTDLCNASSRVSVSIATSMFVGLGLLVIKQFF